MECWQAKSRGVLASVRCVRFGICQGWWLIIVMHRHLERHAREDTTEAIWYILYTAGLRCGWDHPRHKVPCLTYSVTLGTYSMIATSKYMTFAVTGNLP